MTEEGPVDIPPEAVERVEGTAEKVEILPEEELPPPAPAEERTPGTEGAAGGEARDRHHTPEFLRKLFLRDGGRCVNPLCGRKLHLNGHHLKPWSRGGRTAFSNEATLCVACHAAVEQGLLRIAGDPLQGFVFTTRADEIGLELAREGWALDALPVVAVQATYVNGSIPPGESTYVDGTTTAVEPAADGNGHPPAPEELAAFETCVAALRSLGSTRDSALRAARRGLAKLKAAGKPIGEEALIKSALARPVSAQ
jgi:HNH endonuclease